MPIKYLKRNDQARAGHKLYLTKPLGIGILTTARKQKLLREEHQSIARDSMCTLNVIGIDLSLLNGVSAITNVTGFGLLGHLFEVCEGSRAKATVYFDKLPLLPHVEEYRLCIG